MRFLDLGNKELKKHANKENWTNNVKNIVPPSLTNRLSRNLKFSRSGIHNLRGIYSILNRNDRVRSRRCQDKLNFLKNRFLIMLIQWLFLWTEAGDRLRRTGNGYWRRGVRNCRMSCQVYWMTLNG